MNERSQDNTPANANEHQHLLGELQKVIAVMVACCDAMSRRLPPGQADRELAEIQRSVNRASVLTQEFVRQGRPASPEAAIDINRLVLQHGGILLRLLGPAISVRMQLTPLPSRVHVRPVDVERILLNLVLNARDAMPDGGVVTVETSVVGRADAGLKGSIVDAGHAGPFLQLTVGDTGSGVNEVVDHLTESLFTTNHPCIGAGMDAVRATVHQLSGALRIETSRGGGSRVMVFLPLAPAGSEPGASCSAPTT